MANHRTHSDGGMTPFQRKIIPSNYAIKVFALGARIARGGRISPNCRNSVTRETSMRLLLNRVRLAR